MTRDEVRNLMHDYFDGLLSPDEKSTIDSYLEEYIDLAQEYELLGKLLQKAEGLPIGIKIPDTVLKKVSAELLTKSLEKIESDKQKKLRELTENIEKEGEKRKKLKKQKGSKDTTKTSTKISGSTSSVKKPLILILIVLVCVAGYYAYDYFNTNLPWDLKAVYGQYQIGTNISVSKTLDEQETLSTLDSTLVSVNIPNAGRLDVGSFSSFQLIKGKDRENIINLIAGRITADCKIDNPKLTVKTQPVDIIAKGGNFSVALDDQGDINVQTTNGIVDLKNPNEELLLIQDHNCKILSTGEIGIPYHIDADPALAELVLKVSFEGGVNIDLGQLLTLATPLDGITLLYLIKETKNASERLPIFLKLNELYPVPPGITQEGILKLDENMLELWRTDIEWQI